MSPTLWNIFYDAVLRLEHEGNVKVFAYADDLALVITSKDVDELRNVAAS